VLGAGLLAALLFLLSNFAVAAEEEIDWNRARTLNQKAQRGEALTPEEQAYLDRARQARARQGTGARSQPEVPPAKAETGLVPLTELEKGDYKGESGGLYGNGQNTPLADHLKAAQAEAAKVQPLDAEGKPAADGKIALVSIGMSNTSQEFARFKEVADADPEKSPRVVVVNGAQGGQDAAAWANPGPLAQGRPDVWGVLETRLKEAGVAPAQVQVIWLKQALIQPARLGQFPDHARKIEEDVIPALNRLKAKYRNLRVAYLSSRIYAGYATTALNPEPYAYESAFAVRWLIQAQSKGDPRLNYSPERGEVKAPLLLWGPYLWGDGVKPRKADGLVWKREDLGPDGTHPSDSGRQKVADLLLTFFKTDATARPWFVGKPMN
jgi:hypothetical protein